MRIKNRIRVMQVWFYLFFILCAKVVIAEDHVPTADSSMNNESSSRAIAPDNDPSFPGVSFGAPKNRKTDDEQVIQVIPNIHKLLGSKKPWHCSKIGDGTVTNEHASAVVAFNNLSTEKKSSYPREYDAVSQKDLDAAIKAHDISKLITVANQYRLIEAGNGAINRILAMLLEVNDVQSAYYFFVGWKKNNTFTCTETNTTILIKGLVILKQLNEKEQISSLSETLKKCPDELGKTKIALESIKQIPSNQLLSSFESDGEKYAMLRSALTYANAHEEFMQRLQKERPDTDYKSITFCEAYDAEGSFLDALKNVKNENDKKKIPLLSSLLPDQKKWVTILSKIIEDSKDNRRVNAITALISFGEMAIPALTTALNDPDENVRYDAVSALGKFGENAIPALITALKDPDENVRYDAASALGKFGEKAIPALTTALKDPNKVLRITAVQALGEIGVKAIPALTIALNDKDAGVRSIAVYALGHIGEKAEAAVVVLILPALTKALNDEHTLVRSEAAEALDKIQKK